MKLIIFAGGAGTRLWPLSRKNSPKQFGKVLGDRSTIQMTVDRLLPSFNPQDIFIATGEQYKNIVFDQLPLIPEENFIFEPAMRDVGPAIGLVCSLIEKRFGNEPIAILWSDHMVKKDALFRDILLKAEKQIVLGESSFIFIAQTPRFANQNMGWIELGDEIQRHDSVGVYKFSRLLYRPSLPDAKKFFENKNFVWNLGYFVTTAPFVNSLFKEHAFSMYEKLEKISNSYLNGDYEKNLHEIYPELEKISFDDIVLTKIRPSNVLVYSADIEWSDVGAWESLKEALSSAAHQNVIRGNALVEDCEDVIIFNEGKQLLVGVDMEGYVMVNTDDVILVCPKSAVPKIKKVVEKLLGTEHEHLV